MTLHNLAITITIILAVSTTILALFALQYNLYISLPNPHRRRHIRKFLLFAISGTPRFLLALTRLIDHLPGRIDQHGSFEIDVTLTWWWRVLWLSLGWGCWGFLLRGMRGREGGEGVAWLELDGERGLAATWVWNGPGLWSARNGVRSFDDVKAQTSASSWRDGTASVVPPEHRAFPPHQLLCPAQNNGAVLRARHRYFSTALEAQQHDSMPTPNSCPRPWTWLRAIRWHCYKALFIMITGFLLTTSDYLPGTVAKMIDTTCPNFECEGLPRFVVWMSIFFALCTILIAGYGFFTLVRDVFGPVGQKNGIKVDMLEKRAVHA